MSRTYYLNFGDLSQDAQFELLACAEEDIRNNPEEMQDILDTYGEQLADGIVAERAERLAMDYDFVFNM